MTDIKIPLRDMRFAMRELLDWDQHYASLGYEEATPDLVDAILEEGAKFCENVLAPLNAVGDQQGCTWNDGEVTTPEGFKEAYQQFVEAGWPSLAHDVEYGGQGLPPSLGTLMSEMVGTTNWSWGMYPGLSHGAMNTLEAHGKSVDLDFGNVISSYNPGTVVLSPDGTRVANGVQISNTFPGNVNPAEAMVNHGNNKYSITLPESFTLYNQEDPNQILLIDEFKVVPEPGQLMDILKIGATLNLKAKQPSGYYTNSNGFNVTVSYN